MSFVAFVSIAAGAVPARAELVFFANGRSLSVKGHRFDGDSLVLVLRSGGEIVCERSIITRIAPDEVPYPEPQPAAAAAPPAAPLLPPPEYARIVTRVAREEGVDARLVNALIQVESGYQPRARSPKGAMGLMQLMPETAQQYAVTNPYEPAQNITAGIRHLKTLLGRFPTVALALAAYNAGESAVVRYGGIPPYGETRSYVARILKLFGAGGR
ncbi:MAG: lytic transglycosylase domain-containing protein [Betaproteobacteria bacterium]